MGAATRSLDCQGGVLAPVSGTARLLRSVRLILKSCLGVAEELGISEVEPAPCLSREGTGGPAVRVEEPFPRIDPTLDEEVGATSLGMVARAPCEGGPTPIVEVGTTGLHMIA